MENKELIKTFDDISKQNDKMIEQYDEITPVCFLIYKDKVNLIGMSFESYEQKVVMRNILKKMIVSQKILGYILIFDARMTSKNIKTEKVEVVDAVIRALYTPKGVLKRQFVIHENKKIIKIQEIENPDRMRDEWDIWSDYNSDEDDEETNKWYQEFKKQRPDLFKDVE
jgi:hypothetical protein